MVILEIYRFGIFYIKKNLNCSALMCPHDDVCAIIQSVKQPRITK